MLECRRTRHFPDSAPFPIEDSAPFLRRRCTGWCVAADGYMDRGSEAVTCGADHLTKKKFSDFHEMLKLFR